MRVEVAVAGHPDRAVEDRGHAAGSRRPGLFGAEMSSASSPMPRARLTPALQLEEAVLARRDAQAADRLENAEAVVQLDRCSGGSASSSARVELRHEPGSVVGRAARQLALLEQQHVASMPARARW